MSPAEIALMAEVEDHHFWYRGLRELLLMVLAPRLPARPRILDAGCGTGANLRALGEALDPSYLGGFDLSEEALRWARAKAPRADLYRSDIRDPELRATGLDLVLSTDVLYVPGADAALPGLERLVSALAPGGVLLLHLPAYDWLYSEHDVAVHTTERYTARRVRRLLERLGLRIELLSYRLCALFPLIVAHRLPRLASRHRRAGAARSDLRAKLPPRLEALFGAVVSAENRLVARGVPLPWGSSVFALG
ncbi:MAG TPA: class I SAM-dependent methyltransferase, partial [Sandaracinaceae bacterium]